MNKTCFPMQQHPASVSTIPVTIAAAPQEIARIIHHRVDQLTLLPVSGTSGSTGIGGGTYSLGSTCSCRIMVTPTICYPYQES